MNTSQSMGLLLAGLVMLLTACGGSSGGSGAAGEPVTEQETQAGLVVTVGLSQDDPVLLQKVEDEVVQRLGQALLPATVRSQRIHCPAGVDQDEMTGVCYDLKVVIPVVIDALRAQRLRQLVEGQQLLRQLEASDALPVVEAPQSDGAPLPSGVSFLALNGLVWGEQVGLLFALRNGLAWQPEAAPAARTTAAPALMSVAATSDRVRLDEPLMWRNPTTLQVKNEGYQARVLAPGYSDGDSSGYWVMEGLSARVGNGKLRCLKGRFVDLRDPRNIRTVESPANCGSVTRSVSLSTANSGRVAAGVQMKVSGNDVVGLGLAWGTLATEVDLLSPDFLLNTSEKNVVHDGKKDGTFNPDPFKQLNGNWPYVVIGVEARATDSKVSGLTLHVAELTATAPAPDALWPVPQTAYAGYRVDQIESAVTDALTDAFQRVADPDLGVRFESFPPPTCEPGSSRVVEIDPCDQFYARYSESSNETRQECEAGCAAAKTYCDTLVADCQAQSLLTPGLSCAHPCEEDVQLCYESCAWPQPSHTVRLNMLALHGLEQLRLAPSTMPFLTQGLLAGVDTTGYLDNGLTATVAWELCRTGSGSYCESGVSPLTSGATSLRMRSRLNADGSHCAPGERPALGLEMTLEFAHWGAWDVAGFAADVARQAGMSFDWAEDTLAELIRVNWQDELVTVGERTTDAVRAAMQQRLDEAPVLPCNG